MTDGNTDNNDLDWKVRLRAGEILASVEEDHVGRLGVMHATTMLITAMAIEAPDPAKMIEDLAGDIHAEATAMVELILASKVIVSESAVIVPEGTNIIWMEKLQ